MKLQERSSKDSTGIQTRLKRAFYLMCILAIFSLVLLPSTLAIRPGVSTHQSEELFRGDVKVIDFNDLSFGDSVSEHYWDSHGVRFSDNDKVTPILIAPYNRGGSATISEPYSIFSDGDWPETSANEPLEIDFKEGQRKVGMYVGNSPERATLIAYDKSGNQIVSFSRMDVADSVKTFMGISSEEDAIYTVKLDYGDTLIGEEIDNLMFVPFEPKGVVLEEEESVEEVARVCSGHHFLEVGESERYKIGDETYTVTIGSVGRNRGELYADFNVGISSGEWQEGRGSFGLRTFSLNEGESYNRFRNEDVVLSADNIVFQEYAGGLHGVDFCFNGKKVKALPALVEVPEPRISQPKCGDSYGGDGYYTACKGDVIKHKTGMGLRVNGFTRDSLVLGIVGTDKELHFEGTREVIKFKQKGIIYNVEYNSYDVSENRVTIKIGQSKNSGATLPWVQNYDLSNVYKKFVDGNSFSGFLVVGSNSPASDNLALVDIGIAFSDVVEVVDVSKLDREVPDIQNHDAIVIGRPCENKAVSKLLGNVHDCHSGLLEGQGLIKLYQHEDKVQVLITGYDTEETRKAAKLFSAYVKEMLDNGRSNHELDGNEVVVVGSKEKPKAMDWTGLEEDESVSVVPRTRPARSKAVSIQEPACNGCQPNGVCLPFGTRLIHERVPAYCELDGGLNKQKSLGDACQNNCECLSNQCSNGQCIDISGELAETRGLVEGIMNWLKGFFGNRVW